MTDGFHSLAEEGRARVPSIDAARAIAIFAVAAIHCDPFSAPRYVFGGVPLGDVIDLLARFAVPFFFITSGFLLGRKRRRGEAGLGVPSAVLRRLLGLIFFWYAFYLVWPADWARTLEQGWARTVDWNVLALIADPANLLVGPRAHLWFLPALLIGFVHVLAVASCGSARFSVLYFTALYLLGLGQAAYHPVPLLSALGPALPATLMTSPLLIAIGFWSAAGDGRPSPITAAVMFALGTASTCLEAWGLLQFFDVPLSGHDFLLGTPLQAFGLLCLLRAFPQWAARTPLPSWGRYTLGIYAAHVAVIEAFGARAAGGVAWEFFKTPLVYATTLVLVVLLGRFRLIRPFLK